MRKIYTSVLVFALISASAFAQSNNTSNVKKEIKQPEAPIFKKGKVIEATNKDAQIVIWEDDLSDASTWVLDHANTCTLDWEIGIGLTNQGDFPSATLTSTTADNGYAMLDSDLYGQNGSGDIENSWFTNAEPIDLSANPYVLLEFEGYYRAFNTDACFVVISTNNTDWPNLDYLYDADSNPNVWKLYENVAVNNGTDNPEVTRINITDVAANQDSVWVRFNWTGIYGYTWFVDDVKILELSANDMRLDYGVISHNSTGDEYARVPLSQMNDVIELSALTTNFGYEAQTDVIIDIEVLDGNNDPIIETSSPVEASLEPDTEFFYATEEDATVLGVDYYTTTFTVTSAEEQDGDDFDNNAVLRTFEITDAKYSLDGIGVHPVSTISSLGTNSWTPDTDDGFMMMVMYDLNQDVNEVYGAEFLITSTTVAGGSVIIHVMDTADVFGDNIDDPIVSSDEHEITQADVDNGTVTVYFDFPETLPANAYFLAVEMNSIGNQYPIRILDDMTVPQPSGSSMIWYTDDAAYSNGNAAAIRMLMSGVDAISELKDEATLTQNAPNPAVDHTTISFDLETAQKVTIRITDLLGKIVIQEELGNLAPGAHSRTINLQGLNAGTYHYSIVTDNGSLTKSMQIIK